jgi:transcriptional regulator with XRE-family HTH domain
MVCGMVADGREPWAKMVTGMDAAGVLDQIESAADLAQVQVAAEPLAFAPKQAIQKVNYSHDGMINLLLTRRGISQNELARHFGYSPSWISQVMSSDAFQSRLAERAAEIEDPVLRASIEDGLKGILARSMELLKEKLDKPDPPDNLVLRSIELSSKALGYGAKETTVVVNHNEVNNHLEVLGGRLTDLLHRKKSEPIPHLEHQP